MLNVISSYISVEAAGVCGSHRRLRGRPSGRSGRPLRKTHSVSVQLAGDRLSARSVPSPRSARSVPLVGRCEADTRTVASRTSFDNVRLTNYLENVPPPPTDGGDAFPLPVISSVGRRLRVSSAASRTSAVDPLVEPVFRLLLQYESPGGGHRHVVFVILERDDDSFGPSRAATCE